MKRPPTDLEVARALHYNESLRAPEPAELEHSEILALFASDDDVNVSVVLDPDGCFRAIDLDNYDVDCDHTGFFSNSPVGYGRTPLDAIICLLDEVEAQNNGK